MSSERHVEIAGAGFSGLLAANALAQRGWSVRVHERGDELRMFGAGIWMWENGLAALDNVGVLEGAVGRGQMQSAWEARDHRGRVIRRREFTPDDRMIVPPREHVYQALVDKAIDSGVKIETASEVAAAHPNGELVLQSGQVAKADLVIGADGIHSKVRAALRIPSHSTHLPNGAIRLLIPRMDYERDRDVATEYWKESRVLLYTPCTPDEIYLCFVCPVDDDKGREVPVNKRAWKESFPLLADAIDRVEDQGHWDRLETVTCDRWSRGRVALVGDAAHGQPPWLGQAANLAFANALGLAQFVWNANDIEDSLVRWERAARPVTDRVQRWTNIYGRVVAIWPPQWESMRSRSVRWFTRMPWVEQRLNTGPKSRPIGT